MRPTTPANGRPRARLPQRPDLHHGNLVRIPPIGVAPGGTLRAFPDTASHPYGPSVYCLHRVLPVLPVLPTRRRATAALVLVERVGNSGSALAGHEVDET